MSAQSPLSREKRTSRLRPPISGFDPQETFGGPLRDRLVGADEKYIRDGQRPPQARERAKMPGSILRLNEKERRFIRRSSSFL